MKKLVTFSIMLLCLVNALWMPAFASNESFVDHTDSATVYYPDNVESMFSQYKDYQTHSMVNSTIVDTYFSQIYLDVYEDTYNGTTYYKIGSRYFYKVEDDSYSTVTDSTLIAQLKQLEFSKICHDSEVKKVALGFMTTLETNKTHFGVVYFEYSKPSLNFIQLSKAPVLIDLPYYGSITTSTDSFVLDWGFYLLVITIFITIVAPYFVLFFVKGKEKNENEEEITETAQEPENTANADDENALYGKGQGSTHKWTLDYFVFMQALVCVVSVVNAAMYSMLTALFVSSIITAVASVIFAFACAYNSSLKLRMILINASAILCAICLFCMFGDIGWWIQGAISLGISVLVSLGIPFCKKYIAPRLAK